MSIPRAIPSKSRSKFRLKSPPSPPAPALRPAASPVTRQRRDSQSADRKSTRLNSSHGYISYAVVCLNKKRAPLGWIHDVLVNRRESDAHAQVAFTGRVLTTTQTEPCLQVADIDGADHNSGSTRAVVK